MEIVRNNKTIVLTQEERRKAFLEEQHERDLMDVDTIVYDMCYYGNDERREKLVAFIRENREEVARDLRKLQDASRDYWRTIET